MALDRDLVDAALPGYEVGAEIGRGAWGVVLEGRHRSLGRAVAIKQLPRAFAADAAVRARFVAEARLVASLDHPHIVPVYDYVEQDGLCLLVMEQLTGGTLWQRASTSGLATEEACAVLLAVCSALAHAHGKGVLHRDVKPDNVMFSTAGTVKLTDFGIAKVLGAAATGLTAAGTVVGTPAYMSPEQAMGRPLGPPTDVFAAAVVLYELLSGRLPFPESSEPMAELYERVNGQACPLRLAAPDAPADLAEVVDRALAREVSERFESADAFGAALAGATARAYGGGWLGRVGVQVLGGTALLAAADQAADPAAVPSRRTILTLAPHARLGAVEPSDPPPPHPAVPTAPPIGPPSSATPAPGSPAPGTLAPVGTRLGATPPPRETAPMAPPTAADPPGRAPTTLAARPTPAEPHLDDAPPVAPAPLAAPPATPARRWLMATVAVAVILAAAGAFLLRGDGDGPPVAKGTASSLAAALTDAERSAFLARCASNRLNRWTPDQCSCALNRLEQGSAPKVEDVRKALLVKSGDTLPQPVLAALASCIRSP